MSKIEIIENLDHFNRTIKDKIFLVIFSASWCGSSNALSDILLDKYDELQINIARVDCDTCSDIMAKYGVTVFPVMMIFKNGVIVSSQVGTKTESDLIDWISENV